MPKLIQLIIASKKINRRQKMNLLTKLAPREVALAKAQQKALEYNAYNHLNSGITF